MPSSFQRAGKTISETKPKANQKAASKSILGWTSRNAKANIINDVLRVSPDGKQPFLTNAKVRVQGPAQFHVRIRTQSNGKAKVQWRTENQATFPASSQTASLDIEGGDWRELSVPLSTENEVVHLRFFIPSQKQPVEIDWLEVSPDRTNVKSKQRWDFKAPGKKQQSKPQ